MRNVLLSLTLASVALSACKTESEEAPAVAEETTAAPERESGDPRGAIEDALRKATQDVEGGSGDLEEGMKDLQGAMGQLQKALGQNLAKVEPINFRELKTLLPEKVGDLARTAATGEKSGAAGVKVSRAEGKYRDGDTSARIEVIDMGTVKGFAAMASAGWGMAEIDRETEHGYERTTKFDGHKGYEKWDGRNQRGEVKTIVADRFMVSVEGRGVPMKALTEALKEVGLGELAKMKNAGTSEE